MTSRLQPGEPPTQRLALLVEYDGTFFFGSQAQSHNGQVLPTIQSAVESALDRLAITHGRVHFAGRTDAGVHARGQVGHVDVAQRPAILHWDRALNAFLPDCIRVRATSLAAPKFHAQRLARGKWYRYQVLNQSSRSVWDLRDAALFRPMLSLEPMLMAAQDLVGVHDFVAFHGRNTAVVETVCQVSRVRIEAEDRLITIDVAGDRFLYNMVRNMVGVLLAIGCGKLPPTAMAELIAARDFYHRTRLAPTALPGGLSLMAVAYDSPFAYFSEDPRVRLLADWLTPTAPPSNSSEPLPL